jgi:hypothetical protein
MISKLFFLAFYIDPWHRNECPLGRKHKKGEIKMKNEKQNKQRKEEEKKTAEEMFKVTRLYYI